MAVSREDVRKVAELARLGISDDVLSEYVGQLNGILEHMDVLRQVESSGAMKAAEENREGMRLRADEPGDSVKLATDRESFAPLMRDGFFLVPRLATHEDSGDES